MCLWSVFSVVFIGGGVCSIVLFCYLARCFMTMVVCIVVRLVFMFCNGVWVCDDVCCVCRVVKCGLFHESGSVFV